MIHLVDMGLAAADVVTLGYIGPGPGLGMLGALIGLIVTIVTAIGAALAWPLRKMLKSKKNDDEEAAGELDEEGTDGETGDALEAEAESDTEKSAA